MYMCYATHLIFTVVQIHFLFNKNVVIRRILVRKQVWYYTDQLDDQSTVEIIIQLRKIMLLGRSYGKRQTSVSIFTGRNNRRRVPSFRSSAMLDGWLSQSDYSNQCSSIFDGDHCLDFWRTFLVVLTWCKYRFIFIIYRYSDTGSRSNHVDICFFF